MKKASYFWRKGIWALISLGLLGLLCLSMLYIYLQSQLPDIDSLRTVQLQVPLRIYTRDGLLIQEYGEKRRIPVSYEQIPQDLVHAILATEDQRFFEHPGVDFWGLGRAAVKVLQTGTKAEGGSTITMQVARNFFLSRKKTYLRKVNEILLAIKIDKELSKEKILELYLNKIYLGNRAYGVGAAAMVYYGKELKDLNLAQLAMMAGLPQAPSTQNPIINPLAAMKRRNHVLERMLEENYITEEQYHEAVKQPLTAKYHKTNIEVSAPYIAEMIRQSLYEHFGPEAYTKGYKVYTTVEAPLQIAANEAVIKNLEAYSQRHGYRGPVANIGSKDSQSQEARHQSLSQYPEMNGLLPAVITRVNERSAEAVLKNGTSLVIPWSGLSWARPALKKGWVGKAPQRASQVVSEGDIVYVRQNKDSWDLTQIPQVEAALVSIDPQNGAIRALVGGFSFVKSKFNRVTQMSRQPGSTIKPFIYAAALNKGYTLATLINDAPIVVDDPSQAELWRPHNASRKFYGPTRLKEALIRSRNMVSIRILDDIGIDYTVDYLSRFGFNPAHLPKSLSLALGSLSASPMDMAAAYTVFANGGFRVEPYLIDHIKDSENNILLQARPVIACDPCDENQDPATVAPRVISKADAFLMNTALRDVIQKGTGRGAKVLKRDDIAGKTGTTNDKVDAWFSGFNADLVTSVWVGFNTPQSLHEYAASLALPLWVDYMKVALKDKPPHELKQPDDVLMIKIDPKSGNLAVPGDQNAISEYFQQDKVPQQEENYSAPEQGETIRHRLESLF